MSKNTEGWIRHRGGKCPVDGSELFDVRFRSGEVERNDSWPRWTHNGGARDIMAYRLHKPAEQVEACSKPELQISLPDNYRETIGCSVEGPLQWRDRITDLDEERKTIDALYQVNITRIETERADLVQKLASEGFALIGRVVEPVEDVSLRNIKAGDTVVYVKESNGDFTNGRKYSVLSVDSSFAPYNVIDDEGDENCLSVEECAFHSRPSA